MYLHVVYYLIVQLLLFHARCISLYRPTHRESVITPVIHSQITQTNMAQHHDLVEKIVT